MTIGLCENSCKESLVIKISTKQYTKIGSGKIIGSSRDVIVMVTICCTQGVV